MEEKKDTYRYWFKVGNLKITCGITQNLVKREYELKKSGKYTVHNGTRYYWANGRILQQGHITTQTEALNWQKENNCLVEQE